jgi:tryptophan 2-monooxygenase
MALHKGIDKFIDRGKFAAAPTTVGPWQFQFPNTADFNFNYWALLNNATQSAIAQNNDPSYSVAVIGAGVAGLVAARELYRSGFVNIDIYEASDRLGGRNYSLPPVSPNQYTTFEMGAMRMPFFWPYDPQTNPVPSNGGPGSQNCVLDYYCTNFGITTQVFPDPGSSGVASTGIYTNNGLGPDPANPVSPPQLEVWATGQLPPTAILKSIYAAWSQFANLFQQTCYSVYGTPQWESFWQAIVQQYWAYNFRDLVYLPLISDYDPSNPGYFGGLGLNETEAWDFYVIGAGDGGWGAFFDISCLYPIRTLLFGFGNVHQLIQGTFNNGQFNPGLQYQQTTKDNLRLPRPIIWVFSRSPIACSINL